MKASNLFKISFIAISLQLILSCDNQNSDNIDSSSQVKTGPGGIVLTFDDLYIDNWYAADSIFARFNGKATFCVTAYGRVDEEGKQKLLELQAKGHEIAHHTFKHYNPNEFLLNHSLEEYINTEVIPAFDLMTNDGLNITSFVYPGGVRTVEMDSALFEYFSVLRGTTYNQIPPKNHTCFLRKGESKLLVYGLGIDNHYDHFNIEYITDLMDYAIKEGIALIFYGHNITNCDTTRYVTSYKTLEMICSYAQENNMKFLTLRDLTIFNSDL